ncbi:hypothetical protein GCM10009715_00850 [Paeniglutamicibacter psychrophenolicus]
MLLAGALSAVPPQALRVKARAVVAAAMRPARRVNFMWVWNPLRFGGASDGNGGGGARSAGFVLRPSHRHLTSKANLTNSDYATRLGPNWLNATAAGDDKCPSFRGPSGHPVTRLTP